MFWNEDWFIPFFAKKEARKIALNFANFGIYQIINYLIPLITIPYIIRVVGIDNFGIISFAQAVIYFLLILVEYGFSITGVQMIAQNKNDSQKQSEIISTIFIIQTVFMLISLLLLVIASICVQEVKSYYLVFMFSFLILPAFILQALWFYIGNEEMQFLNIINFISRTIYTILIFIFIRQSNDFILVPLLNSGAMLLAGIVGLSFIMNRFDVKFHMVKIETIKQYLRDGWHLFISNVAMNLYRNSNIIILGFVANKEIVGIYSAGEKLIKALQSVFTPLTQTLYPYLSRQKLTAPGKSVRSVKILVKYMVAMTGIITFLVIIFAVPVTKLFVGVKFQVVSTVVKIGSTVIIFGTINYILGIIFMTNFNMKRQFSQAVFITGIVNLIICLTLSSYFNAIGTAIAFSFSEILLCILLLLFIQSNREKWAIVT